MIFSYPCPHPLKIPNAENSIITQGKNIPSKKFVPWKTLLFFDGITEFPEIATSLKFFCIDGRFDVICSGSMLGVNYKRIESNSVGYKKDYDMVAEALVKQGYKLFYFKKEDSTLEEDFFIRSTASLIPVEVKAKSGRAKSWKR